MGRLTRGFKPRVRSKKNSLSSLLPALLEVGCQRVLPVNNEKFLTGQVAGFSNGVKEKDDETHILGNCHPSVDDF